MAIREIQRELGVTACYVTHDQEEALGVADRIAVMRNGRVLQVGTPEEIYARPATEFVAGFVGISTILNGTAESGLARTALGEYTAAGVPDGPVRLAVRPESVRIDSDGPCTGKVTKAAYRGDRWLLTVSANETEVLAYAAAARSRGDEVKFGIEPAPVPVAPDEVAE
jgi:ABC-type Fe3+/spermidine/putrescine transport system ATPase subunit